MLGSCGQAAGGRQRRPVLERPLAPWGGHRGCLAWTVAFHPTGRRPLSYVRAFQKQAWLVCAWNRGRIFKNKSVKNWKVSHCLSLFSHGGRGGAASRPSSAAHRHVGAWVLWARGHGEPPLEEESWVSPVEPVKQFRNRGFPACASMWLPVLTADAHVERLTLVLPPLVQFFFPLFTSKLHALRRTSHLLTI